MYIKYIRNTHQRASFFIVGRFITILFDIETKNFLFRVHTQYTFYIFLIHKA